MEKEFIPYAEASALKELGFNKYSELIRVYEDQTGKVFNPDFTKHSKNDLNDYRHNRQKNYVQMITFSQAFRFFRENYGLESYINPELPFSYNNPKYTVIVIKTIKNFTTYKDDTIWVKEGIERKRFNPYEEAELECLKKLIEIVKNK